MQDPVRRSSGVKHPALLNIDPATRWLYTPHTISALFVGMRVLPATASDFTCSSGMRTGVRMHTCELFDRRRSVDCDLSAFHAGLVATVYLSGAFNPPPEPANELEAAKTANDNAKWGLAAAALLYLCKLPVTTVFPTNLRAHGPCGPHQDTQYLQRSSNNAHAASCH